MDDLFQGLLSMGRGQTKTHRPGDDLAGDPRLSFSAVFDAPDVGEEGNVAFALTFDALSSEASLANQDRSIVAPWGMTGTTTSGVVEVVPINFAPAETAPEVAVPGLIATSVLPSAAPSLAPAETLPSASLPPQRTQVSDASGKLPIATIPATNLPATALPTAETVVAPLSASGAIPPPLNQNHVANVSPLPGAPAPAPDSPPMPITPSDRTISSTPETAQEKPTTLSFPNRTGAPPTAEAGSFIASALKPEPVHFAEETTSTDHPVSHSGSATPIALVGTQVGQDASSRAPLQQNQLLTSPLVQSTDPRESRAAHSPLSPQTDVQHPLTPSAKPDRPVAQLPVQSPPQPNGPILPQTPTPVPSLVLEEPPEVPAILIPAETAPRVGAGSLQKNHSGIALPVVPYNSAPAAMQVTFVAPASPPAEAQIGAEQMLPQPGAAAAASLATLPPVAPTFPTLPNAPTLVAQQIAAALQDRGGDPGQPLELALDPPELGRVRMHMAELAGVLTLTIHAERPETAELMRRHLELLAQEFAEAGVDAPSVRISQDGADSGTGGDGSPDTASNGSGNSEDTDHATAQIQTRSHDGALDLRL